jgi:CDP-diacylglycerol--serine O-phosphatidyltransferase
LAPAGVPALGDRSKMARTRQLRRGIYLLPTLFTLGNMFCGYSSVVQASSGHLRTAAMLIVLAAVLDGLDGRIARLTGSTSEFGLQFDSLADVVSFGVAPAMLAYHWGLGPGRLGWSLAFLYVVCAATRLARYNIKAPKTDSRYFAGLPSPMAGCAIASLAFAYPEPPRVPGLSAALAGLVFGAAVLMISRLRYRSFREIDLRHRRSYTVVLPIAAVLVAITLVPEHALLTLCSVYLLSGPLLYLWDRRAARRGQNRTALGSNGAESGEVVDGPPVR